MTDFAIVTITDPTTGRAYGGNLPLAATITNMRPPLSLGMSVKPEETYLFDVITPAAPGWSNVFAAPGAGLPKLNGKAIKGLPAGTLPFTHHKDPVPLDSLRAYWTSLQDQFQPPAGRRFRWTFQHEKAPADRAARLEWFAYWSNLVKAAADFPWIELVQVHSDYAMRRRRDTRARDWIIPGVPLAFDSYASRYGNGAPYEPVESAFALLVELAREFGCESFGCAELSADTVNGTPEEAAQWVLDAVGHLDRVGAAFVGLWASHETRGGVYYDYRPNTPPMTAAYRSIFAADL